MTDNPILRNAQYRSEFTEWCEDHHISFGVYPGSFSSYQDDGREIEFSEAHVQDAVIKLFMGA